tara:strand:+ start:13991 stop:14488 length:498 start_codon:yes stop_codon:yes gene_type:complete
MANISEPRNIELSDYSKGLLDMLSNAFTIEPGEIPLHKFNELVTFTNKDHSDTMLSQKIFVIEKVNDSQKWNLDGNNHGEIISCATVIIETKLLHNFGRVAHIEDVTVSQSYRGLGLGKKIINHCVSYAKTNGCYKIILDCEEKNVEFYKKCGFVVKGAQMAVYF